MLHAEVPTLCRVLLDVDVRFWLIGGQAAELLAGRPVRDHDDIDFLVRLGDAERALGVLASLGFLPVHGSLERGDIFVQRADRLLVDLVPIRDGPDPPRTVGALAGVAWPPGLLQTHLVEVDGVPIPTLIPAMHRAMKAVISGFFGQPLREKDRPGPRRPCYPARMTDAAIRSKLTALVPALRHFHSALLDFAKGEYEFLHGPVKGPFALYGLVMNDPAFQWLRPLSGLMATLDEVLDAKDTALTPRNLADVRGALALLFSETDTRFADFRAGYARAKGDARVRETEARWREILSALDA